MMDTKMAEKPPARPRRRHALRDAFLVTGVWGIFVVAAVTLLNQNPPGQEPAFSPLGGVLLAIGGLIGLIAVTIFYMRRTDEHDVTANLWGGLYGWLFLMSAGPVWWMLEHSGLTGPVDFWTLYFMSALVAGGVWGWYRFR